MTEKIIAKMIASADGNKRDTAHFLKVYAYAQTIGRLEGLSPEAQEILEIAAAVHDIACPFCREKYGNAGGKHQEEESEALLRPFLAEFDLPAFVLERVIWLVTHHHTYHPVDGIDHQILLEADFLVNADESDYPEETIRTMCSNVYKTASGTFLLKKLYLS